MRISAVVPRYPPRSRVGAWIATHGWLCHMVQRGHEVVAVATQGYEPDYVHEGVLVEAGAAGRTAPERRAAWADVIVSHSLVIAAELAERHGKPLVSIMHGAGRSAAGASLVVFNSEWMQRQASLDVPSIVAYPPTVRADHAAERGERISIVNCSRDKGIDTAWQIADALPDHPFLGVKGGYGEQRIPRCRNFRTIETTQNMRDDVWSQTRILLMPSAYESWGMVGVEALASGIPVIASDLPGPREALGDAGIFLDHRDVDAWVAAIRRLDDPAEYEAASCRASARFDELETEMAAGLDRFADAVEALA